jgi:hypothetical protein
MLGFLKEAKEEKVDILAERKRECGMLGSNAGNFAERRGNKQTSREA